MTDEQLDVLGATSPAEHTAAVQAIFDRIARRYDRINSAISLGHVRQWRRELLRTVSQLPHRQVLDLACGTGDITIALLEELKVKQMTGVDFSHEMLAIAKHKLASRALSGRVTLKQGAAEELPLPDQSVELATIAFGVRNFTDVEAAMREVRRVLVPQGHLVVLELTRPRSLWARVMYDVYANTILPLLGGLMSGSFRSYTYLTRSIRAFTRNNTLVKAIDASGLRLESQRHLTMGTVELLVAKRVDC